MIGRAVLLAVNDSNGRQLIKVSGLAGEIQENVAHYFNYGFTSNPLPGAEAVVLYLGGDRDNGIAIAVEDKRYRLKGLTSGEVAMYTDEGDKVYLTRGGIIEILAASKVAITAPLVQCSEDLAALGDLTAAEKFGVNGAAAQGKVTLPVNAFNLATTIDLSNAIKALLINNGQAE